MSATGRNYPAPGCRNKPAGQGGAGPGYRPAGARSSAVPGRFQGGSAQCRCRGPARRARGRRRSRYLGAPVNDRRRWWVLAAVSLGTFMTYLDTSVVNVSLITIQRDLGLSIAGLEWIVSGYILVFAGLMLVGGRLADVYGRRRVFLAGLVLFTAASV